MRVPASAPRGPHDGTAFPVLGDGQTLAATGLIALLGGASEGALSIARHWITLEPTELFTTAEGIWAAALTALVVLLPSVLGLLVLDRLVPRLRARRVAVPLVAFACAYSLIIGVKAGVGPWAARCLAVGVAVTVGRFLDALGPRARDGLPRLAMRSGAVLLAFALLVPAARWGREAVALRRLPDAPAAAPNVVVLIWDTVRATNLSLYGYPEETTPTLARLAREGVTFDRAFAPSSWSLPSHASLFTGRYPFQLRTNYRRALSNRWPTLAGVMSDAGYVTGGFTGNLFFGRASYGIARGFLRYVDRPALSVASIGQSWYVGRRLLETWRDRYGDADQNLVRQPASRVIGDFLDWVDHGPAGRPFFSVLNHFDAHEPYLPPAPFDTAIRRSKRRYTFDEETETSTPAIQAQLRASYDDCIRYLDAQLAVLLRELESRHLRENTIIVVTADHGEEFGLRGSAVVGHQRTLYAPVLRVPLVIVDPRRSRSGVHRQETVSLRDLPATIMDLVGRAPASPFPGESLVRFADAPADSVLPSGPRYASISRHPWIRNRPGVPSSYGDVHSVIDGDLHYIIDGRGKESLFNLAEDPIELHNLARRRDAATEEALEGLRRQLNAAIGATFEPLQRVMAATGGAR